MMVGFFDPAVVFFLGTLGCVVAARTGVFCLAIEAIFLNSACAYTLTAFHFGSAVMGLVVGVIVGLLTACVFALCHVVGRLDAIVSGIGINLVSQGLCNAIVYDMTGQRAVALAADLTFTNARWLHPAVLGLAIVVVGCVVVFMEMSIHRNRLICVGRAPKTAGYADISVRKYQGLAVVICGMLGSLAGVYYAAAYDVFGVGQWKEGIGYIMLALAYATRGRLPLVVLTTVAFGYVRALCHRLPQGASELLPAQVLEALPFVFVLVVFSVVGFLRDGRSDERES